MDARSADNNKIREKGIALKIMSEQKFDKSVSLLCWAYNEEKLIINFLEKMNKFLSELFSDYEIVLIDDCSADKTYELAVNFQKQCPNLKIFRNNKNMNVGYCCKRAIKEATKEYLFWQTIDLSYDISSLAKYLKYLNEYDILQGVRRKHVQINLFFLKPIALLLKLFRIQHLTKRSDTIFKAFVSVINYLFIRTLFRVSISDFQNVTIYPTKWIQSITIEANSSFANPELIIKSYWAGLKIKEIPINFIKRKEGKAKGTKFTAIIKAIRDIFKYWIKWVILNKIPNKRKGVINRDFNEDITDNTTN